ncbi:hypothetical protein MNB_ARC-1_810 [hydrothermal vent metagenome]|uniref:Uncharacterized protein n=1 Tax=hydrothermal vent metagenome TaxID=652676 RepID=A0A3B1DX65_9ZZZZ
MERKAADPSCQNIYCICASEFSKILSSSFTLFAFTCDKSIAI